MNLAAVRRVRLEEAGGRGAYFVSTVFLRIGSTQRKFPEDPSVPKAVR